VGARRTHCACVVDCEAQNQRRSRSPSADGSGLQSVKADSRGDFLFTYSDACCGVYRSSTTHSDKLNRRNLRARNSHGKRGQQVTCPWLFQTRHFRRLYIPYVVSSTIGLLRASYASCFISGLFLSSPKWCIVRMSLLQRSNGLIWSRHSGKAKIDKQLGHEEKVI